jgi:hypothetical protein
MTTATEYAQAVRTEEIDFDEALLEYLGKHHSDRLDISFFWVAKIAIGYANMGERDKELDISDDEKLTVRQIIDQFGLEPFVAA